MQKCILEQKKSKKPKKDMKEIKPEDLGNIYELQKYFHPTEEDMGEMVEFWGNDLKVYLDFIEYANTNRNNNKGLQGIGTE